MTARVIASFSSVLRIRKQDFLVGPHGVDHLGLVVVPLGDLRTLMVEARSWPIPFALRDGRQCWSLGRNGTDAG